MSEATKKNKSKTISVRLYDEAYEFIEQEAKKAKITKSVFLISQIDPKSKLAEFLDSDFERMKKEYEELKNEYKEFRESTNKDITSMLEESDDKTILFLYKEDHDAGTRKIFQKIAKKRGLVLPD